MWTNGRATALSVLTPVNRRIVRGQRAFYRFEKPRVRTIHWKTTQMGLVLALRWSLVPAGIAGPRPMMLFQSNFAGDWNDYIDVFVAVHLLGLRAHFFAVPGFKKVLDAGLGHQFIRDRDHEPVHYYCAYPDLTPRDLRLLPTVQRVHADPRWITVLLPGDGPARAAALAAFADAHGVFAVPGVHFGRIVGIPGAERNLVLVSVVIDDDTPVSRGPLGFSRPDPGVLAVADRAVLARVVDRFAELWVGLTGQSDAVGQLLRHRIAETEGLSYFCCPGATAADIHDFRRSPLLIDRT